MSINTDFPIRKSTWWNILFGIDYHPDTHYMPGLKWAVDKDGVKYCIHGYGQMTVEPVSFIKSKKVQDQIRKADKLFKTPKKTPKPKTQHRRIKYA